jgi:hypothetical protein
MGTWEQPMFSLLKSCSHVKNTRIYMGTNPETVPMFLSLMGTRSHCLPIKTLLVPMFPSLFTLPTTFIQRRKKEKEIRQMENLLITEIRKSHKRKRYIVQQREHGNNGNNGGHPWEC